LPVTQRVRYLSEAAAFSLYINCFLGGSTIYYTLLQPLIVIYIEQTLYYPLLQYRKGYRCPRCYKSLMIPTWLSSRSIVWEEP
jgi:hypothetical protein